MLRKQVPRWRDKVQEDNVDNFIIHPFVNLRLQCLLDAVETVQQLKTLFTPIKIGTMELKNRMVQAPYPRLGS